MSTSRLIQKRSKSVACRRCHSRKVKCSGERPCSICRDAGLDSECVYPARDRQVKISQRSLDALIAENSRLRNVGGTEEASSSPLPSNTIDGSDTVHNPLFDERPWFHTVSSSDIPIHIGEAADAAFATRFRQTLGTGYTDHLPRMSYIPDAPLMILPESRYGWPTPARARFLVKVAFSTICRYYHIIRKSVVLKSLDAAISSGGNGDRLVIGKLLALFALGEVYSAKFASHHMAFPGMAYYTHAGRLVGEPMERPQLDAVEVTLLLAVYSFSLNRRHSAYIFASSAIRLSLIMGLQLDISDQQYRDFPAREHRVRLWWTAYIIDRTCTSKIGLPVSIADDDIQVDPPSVEGADRLDPEDFEDSEYELCSVTLSKIAAMSTEQIYSRRVHQKPFSQRVQAILKDLNRWMDELPAKYHLKTNGSSSLQEVHITYLHLRFNQAIILATRPLLLHVLSIHRQAWTDNNEPRTLVSETARILAETCIQCARHSYQIVTDTWVHGTFATFNYFHTQFLFSSATVLAISSLLSSTESENDNNKYDSAVELLRQLDQSGSFVAKEFCEHIDAMQKSMAAVYNGATTRTITSSRLGADQGVATSFPTNGPTAGMALAEPSFRDFLAETDLDIQGFDDSIFDESHALYWPRIEDAISAIASSSG
ncbi:hypothetical protein CC86DRAFT_389739 [Ophiobolus disseminans]|uniref:Zn(2)-C6 fungal-type domain-containing protein n=1 Tax=Ophiobolus disseminans TaxID=1469910 RepID=A0A6A7AKL1_9PLEO|nr:hypothetical protein CC86DRAFT_389739 [Ophiobolus disseminans]